MIRKINKIIQGSKYLKDILWQASGNTVAQLIGILALPIITRIYDPSSYASLTLFVQIASAFAIVITLRYEYLVMLPRETEGSDRLILHLVRLGSLQTLMWTTVVVILLKYSIFPTDLGEVSHWLWLCPVTGFAISLSVGFQQSVQRSGDFKRTAIAELLGRISYVGSCLFGYFYLPNIAGLMLSTFFSSITKVFWTVKNQSGFHTRVIQLKRNGINWDLHRKALGMSLSNIVSLFTIIAPMLFIASEYGEDSLGQYSLVVSTLYLPSTLIGQAIGQVFFQRACQYHGMNKSFHGLLTTTSKHLAFISLPMYAFIGFMAPLLYPMIFGPNWQLAGELSRWLCLAASVGFVSTALDKTSLVVNFWWYLPVWHLVRATVIFFVLFMVDLYSLDLRSCVGLLSFTTALAYLSDWLASKKMSRYAII